MRLEIETLQPNKSRITLRHEKRDSSDSIDLNRKKLLGATFLDISVES